MDPLLIALHILKSEKKITQYLGEIKPGKEASVHCCLLKDQTQYRYGALKVYKNIEFRSFRDDAIYGQGRGYRKGRKERALLAASPFGLEVKMKLWTENEAKNLRYLRKLNLPVPDVVLHGNDFLLMELLGTPDAVLPQLKDADVPRELAFPMLRQLLDDIGRMLRHDFIHADLSPFNILVDGGRHYIIDCPQAVDPKRNDSASWLFRRDVENVWRHFVPYRFAFDLDGFVDACWSRWLAGDDEPVEAAAFLREHA